MLVNSKAGTDMEYGLHMLYILFIRARSTTAVVICSQNLIAWLIFFLVSTMGLFLCQYYLPIFRQLLFLRRGGPGHAKEKGKIWDPPGQFFSVTRI